VPPSIVDLRDIALQVELLYPASLLNDKALVDSLKSLLEHREPHHRSAMWKCLLCVLVVRSTFPISRSDTLNSYRVSPLTAPFALIPIIPK
jgi:hypothetical protein